MGGLHRRSGGPGGEVVSLRGNVLKERAWLAGPVPSVFRIAGSGLGASGSRGVGAGEALDTRLRAPGGLCAGGSDRGVYTVARRSPADLGRLREEEALAESHYPGTVS